MEKLLEKINDGNFKTLNDVEKALRNEIKKDENEKEVMLAKYHLAMLYLQTKNREKCIELARQIGFRYAIDSNIWNSDRFRSGGKFVGAVDNALPRSMFHAICKIFEPKASFWITHQYPSSSFFSYYVSLKHERKRTLLDEIVCEHVIPIVSKTFPMAFRYAPR